MAMSITEATRLKAVEDAQTRDAATIKRLVRQVQELTDALKAKKQKAPARG